MRANGTRCAVPWQSVGSVNEQHARGGFAEDEAEAHKIVCSLINPGESVLEVGCSTGYIAQRLKIEKQCYVVGIEADPMTAEVARETVGIPVYIPAGELADLPEKYVGFFDVVLCADVVEHVTNPWSFVHHLLKYTKASGRFIFSIPNVAHWTCRMMLLRGRWQYEAAGLLDSSHLRFFTRDSALRLLDECGLVVIRARYSAGAWIDAYRRGVWRIGEAHWRLSQLRSRVIRYMAQRWPTLFACQFIFEAKRKDG